MERDRELNVGQDKLHFSIPVVCPHCGVIIDPKIIGVTPFTVDSGKKDPGVAVYSYICLSLLCTNCDRNYVSVHVNRRPASGYDHTTKRIFQYPAPRHAQFDELLTKCSPEFVGLYESAYAAELSSSIRLAGAGYRMALEQLLKDYLINEEGQNPEEVSRLSIAECVKRHFRGLDNLFVSADVVRILGNDYIHYQPKHLDIDFRVLREYLDIFIHAVLTNLKIKHPPVSR